MTTENEKSYLEMSDEEVLNAPEPPPVEVKQGDEAKPDSDPDKGSDDDADPDAAKDGAGDNGDEPEGSEPEGGEAKPEGERPDGEEADDDKAKGEDKAKPDAKKDGEQEGKDDKTGKDGKDGKETKPDETVQINYEAEYKRLLSPFKANGREVQVKSVDDAITLMQMGANYNKKMAALKPNLKLLKMLENNGLLNEDKLAFYIDIEKKNPAAITKLIKDSGINPMDLDTEKANDYKTSTHTVDDREIELDNVLGELDGSPTLGRTLDIVGKQWDSASKQTIANTPRLLHVINDHVERGIYDIISKEIDSERLLGRLNGLSDIEAYRQVGDAIQARGGFNHLGSSQKKPTDTNTEVVITDPKKPDDSKLKDKKRAASSSKPVVPSSQKPDFNPLAISDEEFAKLGDPKFL